MDATMVSMLCGAVLHGVCTHVHNQTRMCKYLQRRLLFRHRQPRDPGENAREVQSNARACTPEVPYDYHCHWQEVAAANQKFT